MKKSISSAIRTLFAFAATILLALIFRSLLFEPFHIPSGSMKPQLLEGDYIFASKYAYGYSRFSFPFNIPIIRGKILNRHPQIGDMVIFKPETRSNVHFVKRVVGQPNDRIKISGGLLYINDEPVKNSFIQKYQDDFYSDLLIGVNLFQETLPNGAYYKIIKADIAGFISDTKEFQVPEGCFFVLGDNRDNSRDSRFIEIGFIQEDYIVGKPLFIALSFDRNKPWYKSLRKERVFKSLGIKKK